MNVLFYTQSEISPQKGGTERISCSVAAGLQKRGISCYSVYQNSLPPAFARFPFAGSFCINGARFQHEIERFITDNQIDIIINQGDFALTRKFRRAVDAVRPSCKIVFCHHFSPGAERYNYTLRNIVYKLREGREVWKNILKLASFPLAKRRFLRNLKADYRATYELSDCVVLLSLRFMDEFKAWGKIEDSGKFREIHNILSFNTFFDCAQYDSKKNTVLIVSRLEETQKRLSFALKIWRQIELNGAVSDWQLKIVGGGQDLNKYRKMAARYALKHVSFEGIRVPDSYYEEASLFMMTSFYEGWGLTLTEAQQMGCVPLAFASYASLPDIITDGVNGCVIPYGDIQSYADKMTELMLNDNLRKRMAIQAVESSKRFASEVVMEQWINLLHELHGRP